MWSNFLAVSKIISTSIWFLNFVIMELSFVASKMHLVCYPSWNLLLNKKWRQRTPFHVPATSLCIILRVSGTEDWIYNLVRDITTNIFFNTWLSKTALIWVFFNKKIDEISETFFVLVLCLFSFAVFSIFVSGGRLRDQGARMYLSQILDGVTYLHEQVGILHRDLKPGNVLLSNNDQV